MMKEKLVRTRLWALLLAMSLTVCLFAGCSGTNAPAESQTPDNTATEEPSETPTPSESGEIAITDMAGREVTFTPAALETIKNDAGWADIQAVQDGYVYPCPSMPQNWFDRSPNPLRVLGCRYTAATCYPEYCTYDLDTEIGDFMHTLYGKDLTTGQTQALYK